MSNHYWFLCRMDNIFKGLKRYYLLETFLKVILFVTFWQYYFFHSMDIWMPVHFHYLTNGMSTDSRPSASNDHGVSLCSAFAGYSLTAGYYSSSGWRGTGEEAEDPHRRHYLRVEGGGAVRFPARGTSSLLVSKIHVVHCHQPYLASSSLSLSHSLTHSLLVGYSSSQQRDRSTSTWHLVSFFQEYCTCIISSLLDTSAKTLAS